MQFKMFRISVAIIAIGVAVALAPARAGEPPSFESVWQAVNAKPNIRIRDEPRDIRIDVPNEQTIYFFTKPGQPEHPAVLKRSIIKNGTGTSIETIGHSFGNATAQAAYARLLEKFKEQDAAMTAEMRGKN